jgi:hypothetical protein
MAHAPLSLWALPLVPQGCCLNSTLYVGVRIVPCFFGAHASDLVRDDEVSIPCLHVSSHHRPSTPATSRADSDEEVL